MQRNLHWNPNRLEDGPITPGDILIREEAEATLSSSLPAGTQHPVLGRLGLVDFILNRLTEAGYALVYLGKTEEG